MKPNLTTTSYAILGHLAMQPWTMYDLAREMQRNVHFFFPRVESQVYAEPKRLVAAGLAKARTEKTGRRPRTIYSITPAGRKELARWLSEPLSKGPLLEFEAVLRVILAPFGRDEYLAASLAQVRDDLRGSLLAVAPRISEEYLHGRAPFQRHAQYRSIVYDFLLHFAQFIDDWAVRAEERMKHWPEMTEEEKHAEGVAIFGKYRAKSKRAPTGVADRKR